MSNYSTNIYIYSYNIDSEELILVYNYNKPSELAYINELRSNSNYLFWNKINPQNQWEIYKMNLNDNSISIIRTAENNSVIQPCLAIDEEYLAWYEATKINDEEIKEELVLYNIKNEVVEYNDVVNLNGNAYSRPFIQDNKLTYLAYENNMDIIKIYDFKSKELAEITASSNIENAMTNSKMTIWHDAFNKCNVYVYDYIENNIYNINSIDSNNSVFSISLDGIYTIINYSQDKDNYSNIYAYDVENKMIYNLTNNKNTNVSFYSVRVMPDNQIIAVSKGEENKYLVINIKQ